MNFFEQQDRARRKTGRLVVLFIVAVIMILIAVNVGAIFIANIASRRADVDPISVCLAATAATLIIIIGGSLYKTAMLAAGGGVSVAEQMGGRPIDPTDLKEQTLQNVVEEMSIASGVPVPRVYVMDHEQGINAFAAGFTPSDAVVAVTRGTLEKLNRDELQGVIGHEFSHILNGDMRLNLRLMGILHGILLIAMTGWIIIRAFMYTPMPGYRYRSRSRDSNSKDQGGAIVAIMLSAVGLIIIGSIGVFFGRLIQAAVSRQREFLADASAVQFTRNPLGLAGALKKIGQFSSRIQDGHAMGAAHLFFGSISRSSWVSLLATHPPLAERIKAIDPTFDGHFEIGEGSADVMDEASPAERGDLLASMLAGAATQPRRPMDARQVVDHAGVIDQRHLTFAAGLLGAIPGALASAAREPFSARAVIFALLVNVEPEVRAKQLAIVQQSVEPACFQQLQQLIEPVAALSEGARLPLLDVTLPALRQLSPQQAERFRTTVRAMIEADGRVTLFEFALNRIIEKNLQSPDASKHEPMSYYAIGPVRQEAAIVLSALASASTSETERAFQAGAAELDRDDPPVMQPIRNLRVVDEALKKLAQCSPPVKQRLIAAFAATVAADGEVNVAEAELLRAVAATMDVPLPPLLSPLPPGAGQGQLRM